MARILGGKSLPFEDVTQMTTTVAADDLGPPTVSIRHTAYCSCYFIVKTWPSAS